MAVELGLSDYRRVTQAATAAGVVALTLSMYLMLPGHRNLALGGVLFVAAVGIVFATTKIQIRPDESARRQLVLISKADCSLCDEARARLQAEYGGRGFTIEVRRIDDDPRLLRQYGAWVPVVLWQNEELAKGRIDWEQLAARLDEIRPRPAEP